MIVDFHTHILPAVDDGSQSISESVKMLNAMGDQGVDCIIATPHFYANRIGLNDFLSNRERAYHEIVAQGLTDIPTMKCGAEVSFFKGIGRSEMLDALCIDNTKLMLLEMPFQNWTAQEYEEVQRIMDKGITPILAHTERYYYFQRNKSAFQEIIQLPLYIQINSEAFMSFRMRQVAFRIIASGKMILLGSDCHNMHERCPNLTAGRKELLKKYGASFLSEVDVMGTDLLSRDS